MKTDLFLELYRRVGFQEGWDIFSSKRFQNLTDEEVKELLGYKAIRPILELYHDEGFNSLPEEIQKKVINLLNKAKHAYQGSYIASDKNVLKSLRMGLLGTNEMLELIRLVTTAEEDYQADYGRRVACNRHVLRSGRAVQLVGAITISERAYYGYTITNKVELVENGRAISYLERINQVKYSDQMKVIVEEAEDEVKKIREDRAKRAQYSLDNFFESLVEKPDETINALEADGIEDITSDTMVRVRQ